MSPEIRPLAVFYNQVQVKSSDQLIGRLGPTELRLMHRLGRAYPEQVEFADLSRQIWPVWPESSDPPKTAPAGIKAVISCLRRTVCLFENGCFTIYCDPGAGYRLAHKPSTATS